MSACPDRAHVRSRHPFDSCGTMRPQASQRNSATVAWTKAIVNPLRIFLVVVVALLGLLAVPVAGAAEPCPGHDAAAAAVSEQSGADVGLALDVAARVADDSNPCPHGDQRPCKSTCGACVATVATLVLPPAVPQPPIWKSQPADLAPPATAPTRLDRPPRG